MSVLLSWSSGTATHVPRDRVGSGIATAGSLSARTKPHRPLPGDRLPKKTRSTSRVSPVRRFFAALGPGVITGAADDDPSGIATYSIAGAQLGTSLLWTALAHLAPHGRRADDVRAHRHGDRPGARRRARAASSRGRLLVVRRALALLAANTINVGADLSGMADAAEMLSGVNSHYLRRASSASAIAVGDDPPPSTTQIAPVLKWLALVLFAYVSPRSTSDPTGGGRPCDDSFRPCRCRAARELGDARRDPGHDDQPLSLLLAGLAGGRGREGAWDARCCRSRERRDGAGDPDRRLDVGVGHVLLQPRDVLHHPDDGADAPPARDDHLETSRRGRGGAAAARRAASPACSTRSASIGVGLLAIPTLAGSAAYAFAETFGWRQGLDRRVPGRPRLLRRRGPSRRRRASRSTSSTSIRSGRSTGAPSSTGCSPRFSCSGILLVASDRKLMQDQPVSKASLLTVGGGDTPDVRRGDWYVPLLGAFDWQTACTNHFGGSDEEGRSGVS